MSDHASSSTATQMAQNSVFERFARAGYVVSGLLHLIIGYLAIRIALGSGGGTADQSGALAAVAAKPGGIVALWVAAVAFLVMALWRLVETALGRSTDPKSQGASSEVLDRAKAFALAVVYFAFAYSTFGFARGAGKSTGAAEFGDQRTPDADRRRHDRTHRRRRDHRRGGRISRLQGSQPQLSRRSQRQLQRPGATTGHGGLHRQRPGHRRRRGAGRRRGESFGARTRPPDSTGPSKHSGPNPTEQRS